MPTRKRVAQTVEAYARRNGLPAGQIPAVAMAVYTALSALERGTDFGLKRAAVPAVPVKPSAQTKAVICLDCGSQAKSIRRHLTTVHGMTIEEYRAKWGLQCDDPMVARASSARQASRATAIGTNQQTGKAVVSGTAIEATNVIERAMERLASETKLGGILTRS